MSPDHPVTLAIHQAIADGVFPGASLLVSRKDEVLWQVVYGNAQILPSLKPLTQECLFDIASLTKPISTATLFMLAVQEGKCALDQPLENYFAFSSSEITLRHLLNHSSGLPAWKPFYKELLHEAPGWVGDEKGKSWLIGRILEEARKSKPQGQVVYSDLGYILLGAILEMIYGETLNNLFTEKVAKVLNLKNTFFNPLEKGSHSLVATEKCPWRGKILCGEVQDEHAYLMGGVAGHAGLFSNTHDIFIWIQELEKARAGKSQFITQNIFDLFCTVPKNRDPSLPYFTLGFDAPSKPSSSGVHFSPNSLGHLGYSGTSFWWDLDKDVCIILLTNRCHPTRENEKIKLFRPKLHDVVMEALGLA
jgi:CubicO group peptidase (beta-lactamase class C family)